MSEFPNLFSPFRIGSVELKNRMFVPGMGTNLAEHNGEAAPRLSSTTLREPKAALASLSLSAAP